METLDAGVNRVADPPEPFVRALMSLRNVTLDGSLIYREVPAPSGLAPWAAAVEVATVPDDRGHTAGRSTLVILYDPSQEDLWNEGFRLVGYGRMEIDADQAVDPLLGEVIWATLVESIRSAGEDPIALTGTVTRELSETFGGLELHGAALVAELRCSWSPSTVNLQHHLEGWGETLRRNAGVSPHNVDTF